jgi:hypothetical protein
MLVKYATLLVGIISTVVWARELRDWRARGLWVGGSLLAAAALGLALYWPWLAGIHILNPAFDEINGKFQFHSLPALIVRLIGDWLPSVTDLDPDAAASRAQFWVYAASRTGFVVYVSWELMRLWFSSERRPSIQTISTVSARVLLIALLLVLTEVHSWYFTWPLTLVTLLGWRSSLTRLVVGYTLTCLPVDYIAMFDWHATLPIPLRVALGAAYLGLPLVVPVAMYARRVLVGGLRSRLMLAAAALAELP